MTAELIIVAAIVALATGFLVRRSLSSLRSESCASGCGSCPAATACSAPPSTSRPAAHP